MTDRSDMELLEALRDLIDHLGRDPRSDELGPRSYAIYRDCFGGLPDACDLARALGPNRNSSPWPWECGELSRRGVDRRATRSSARFSCYNDSINYQLIEGGMIGHISDTTMSPHSAVFNELVRLGFRATAYDVRRGLIDTAEVIYRLRRDASKRQEHNALACRSLANRLEASPA